MGSGIESLVKRFGYEYRYRALPLLSVDTARELAALEDGACTESSLDLGMSRAELCRRGSYVEAGSLSIPMDAIEAVARGGKSSSVYAIIDSEPREVAAYSDEWGFCRLRYLGLGVPTTLEINGIHMHRIEGIDPYRDAELKIRSLGRARGRVLDTCMGLGYTAIKALERGASSVVTVEVNPLVIEIARVNPWSRALESPRITTLRGDVAKLIYEMPSSYFDAAIHDPPRISIAGELYSQEFYRELYRVLKPGARLFHYTGEPGRHGGPSYLKGVRNRLERAGFVAIRWVGRALGFVAAKPRA